MIPRSIGRALVFLPFFFGCASHGLKYHPPDPKPPPLLTQAQLMGLERPERMVRDPETGHWAQAEVLGAYWALQRDAALSGWRLTLISGYRTFRAQEAIWNRKHEKARWSAKGGPVSWIHLTMKYVSVPGFSRHHWGTDLDLGDVSFRNKVDLPTGFEDKRMRRFYSWLEHNAPRYGFCRVYRGGPGSIQDEPWHWSYVRLAAEYDRDVHRISDFSILNGRGVAGWGWLSKNLSEVKRLQVDSVRPECQEIQDYTLDVQD